MFSQYSSWRDHRRKCTKKFYRDISKEENQNQVDECREIVEDDENEDASDFESSKDIDETVSEKK